MQAAGVMKCGFQPTGHNHPCHIPPPVLSELSEAIVIEVIAWLPLWLQIMTHLRSELRNHANSHPGCLLI